MESLEMGAATSQERSGALARAWRRLMGLRKSSMAKSAELAKKAVKLGQDDPRRVTHSLKVGLALSLVSLFYYLQPLYEGFGVNAMWAVMTVVLIFEFHVGRFLKNP